jgi:phosphoesterase RecJ-like protein
MICSTVSPGKREQNVKAEWKRRSQVSDRERAVELLKNRDRFAILAHQSPDGDTLGSAFALQNGLRALGKTAGVLCGDPVSRDLRFLSAGKEHLILDFSPEVFVAVDAADTGQLGALGVRWGDRIDLVIDHHPTNLGYGAINVIDATYAATAELVFELLQELGVSLNREIAQALYTGIATDTGGFRFSNTSPRTMRIAAELMSVPGFDAQSVIVPLFETRTPQRLMMVRLALGTLAYAAGGRIASVVITREMIRRAGAESDDYDALVNLPRSVRGVEVAFSMKEVQENQFRISMRSNTDADVSVLASRFGGGGHAKAAGFSVQGNRAAVRRRLNVLVQEFIGLPAASREEEN